MSDARYPPKNRYRARIHSIHAYVYHKYKNECAGYLYQVSSVSLSICKSCKYVPGDAAQIWSTHFLVSSHSIRGTGPLVAVAAAAWHTHICNIHMIHINNIYIYMYDTYICSMYITHKVNGVLHTYDM